MSDIKPGDIDNFTNGLDLLRTFAAVLTLEPKGFIVVVTNVTWKQIPVATKKQLEKIGWGEYFITSTPMFATEG